MFINNFHRKAVLSALALLVIAGCSDPKTDKEPAVSIDPNPFPSRYVASPSETTLIENVTILDGIGGFIESGSVLMQDGKIKQIGESISASSAAIVIDGKGKWVTPGIIDVHSHLGVYPTPDAESHSDGNEATDPVTAQAWAEHSIWPQDPGFNRALAGGVTVLQILPGSANLVGGRAVTVKNLPNRIVQDMKFPGAPYGMKMACGENPKRVYGKKGGPGTRMGNVAGYRQAWIICESGNDTCGNMKRVKILKYPNEI
jgi:imidazolonepropionase-like amidohydrolase